MQVDKKELGKVAEKLGNGTMTLEEAYAEYPKVGMVIDYFTKHYPDDKEKIANHKMLPSLIFSNYSNTQIEEMIDKLAIFNGWKKYAPTQSHYK